MPQPLISIVMPTFNRAHYIDEAIKSVLEQDYTNWELIIVDDGSTDRTREIVNSYIDSTDRIRYVYQSNAGQSTARQVGLKHSRGEFVNFFDSDDRLMKSCLLELYEALEADPACSIAYGNLYVVDEAGNRLHEIDVPRHSGFITEHLLGDSCVSFNSCLIRKAALDDIGGFDTSLKVADDYDLWLRLSYRHRFVYVDRCLADYRTTPGQISSRKDTRIRANIQIRKKFIEQHPELLGTAIYKNGMQRFYLIHSRYYASIGSRRLALRYFSRAASINIGSRKLWRTGGRLVIDFFSPKRPRVSM
jgi:glycosyltransferase involved in cell wall biosynthesis